MAGIKRRLQSDQPEEFSRRLNQARGGCADAQGVIAEYCRGYLLAVAHDELDDTLKPKVAVSDVVQETFVRAQQGFADFRGKSEAELLAWLRRILLNQIVDVRRSYRQSQKRSVNREVLLRLHESTQMRGVELSDGQLSPASAAVVEDELAKLRGALLELPENYSRVLQMRNWEQLSFVEIAEREGGSPDSVRMLWNRAVTKLGEIMKS